MDLESRCSKVSTTTTVRPLKTILKTEEKNTSGESHSSNSKRIRISFGEASIHYIDNQTHGENQQKNGSCKQGILRTRKYNRKEKKMIISHATEKTVKHNDAKLMTSLIRVKNDEFVPKANTLKMAGSHECERKTSLESKANDILETSTSPRHLKLGLSGGCLCKMRCDPLTCSCALEGIQCLIEVAGFPCGCSAEGCGNQSGRTEFDRNRVHFHYVETIKRLQLEDNN